MLTCRRIVNLAVARQLVGLLPVLPATLSVPLPVRQPYPLFGLPTSPSASAILMNDSVLLTP